MSFIQPPLIQVAQSTTYFQSISLSAVTIDNMSITVEKEGKYKVDFNTQFNTTLANITQQAVVDLNDLYLDLNNETSTGSMPAFTNGTTITAGVYDTAAATSPTGTITFDGEDNEDAIFIFRISAGALDIAASCVFNLIDGATSNNIFFVVSGAVTLGAGSNVSGVFVGGAAFTIGANAYLNGRATTRAGALSNSGNVYVPVLDSQFPKGVIQNFALFSSNGALTNAGSTVIVGDVGTNNGTITGFATASLSGTIYEAAQGASIITVSFYVDSVLQTISSRERTNSITKEDIVSVDVIDLTVGQVVTVKVQNSIGISRFYNRTLLLTEIINELN